MHEQGFCFVIRPGIPKKQDEGSGYSCSVHRLQVSLAAQCAPDLQITWTSTWMADG